jgi:hypothetical protein
MDRLNESHRHEPSLASRPSLEVVSTEEEQEEEEKEISKAHRIESEIQKDKIRKIENCITVRIPFLNFLSC